jgi:hypothetical protein
LEEIPKHPDFDHPNHQKRIEVVKRVCCQSFDTISAKQKNKSSNVIFLGLW